MRARPPESYRPAFVSTLPARVGIDHPARANLELELIALAFVEHGLADAVRNQDREETAGGLAAEGEHAAFAQFSAQVGIQDEFGSKAGSKDGFVIAQVGFNGKLLQSAERVGACFKQREAPNGQSHGSESTQQGPEPGFAFLLAMLRRIPRGGLLAHRTVPGLLRMRLVAWVRCGGRLLPGWRRLGGIGCLRLVCVVRMFGGGHGRLERWCYLPAAKFLGGSFLAVAASNDMPQALAMSSVGRGMRCSTGMESRSGLPA